ncbi:MAG: DegT/DnrJ/EryC1/StrS family aminotransferase [Anaerolineae bacterium]|nr:DegT/DnrJ/EryC1/StrS family aminotransferase [Anaerolineae bacterium]
MLLPIPQTSPRAAYEALKSEIDTAVSQVLESGWYLLGEQTKAFESEYAAWNELAQVVGVGNGTDALELALRVLDVGQGDEVIAPTHTATATIAAIELVGATPILVDIDPCTYTVDVEQVRQAVTNRTKVIIPVHLYGHPADMNALLAIANEHNLKIIEDCAQSHGARYFGKRVGSLGDVASFSFYPTKNLGALGDGGAVGSTTPAYMGRARAVAQYGWHQRYISDEVGMNTRLDELQAAILRCKLRHLDADTQRRVEIANRYSAALKVKVTVPCVEAGCEPVYHLYVIRHPNRDALRQHLSAKQVGTGIHYPLPNHLHPAYRGRLGDTGSFPVAEQLTQEILSLPLYPELTDDQVDYVIESVLTFAD